MNFIIPTLRELQGAATGDLCRIYHHAQLNAVYHIMQGDYELALELLLLVLRARSVASERYEADEGHCFFFKRIIREYLFLYLYILRKSEEPYLFQSSGLVKDARDAGIYIPYEMSICAR